MANAHLIQRLTGIHTMLVGVHQAGVNQTNASKGTERQAFIDNFLAGVMPPIFRFGQGDVTDSKGRSSGQLDVVVEYPFQPSLPLVGAGNSRLYLAEGVAGVIEVKSNLSSQWSQVLATAGALSPLQREFGGGMTIGLRPTVQIPLLVVGYTGWSTLSAVQSKLSNSVSAILSISEGIYADTHGRSVDRNGPAALWALISMLHETISSLKATTPNTWGYL